MKLVSLKKLIVALVFIAFCQCKQTSPTTIKLPAAPMQGEIVPFNITNFKGAWATQSNFAPDFKIDEQFFYFGDMGEFTTYPYRINGDSLILRYPKFDFGYKVVLFKGDSAQFMDQHTKRTYFRVKSN